VWIAAVLGAAVLVYAIAWRVPFESDDLPLIVNNEFLRTGSWRDVFLTSLWGPLGDDAPYYRPVPVLLFKALVHAFGTRPEPFHVVSGLLHGGASALVFLLGRRLVPVAAAGAAALLFAVHPIHTEAVTWASGVMDVGAAFFSLLAVVLHARGTRASRAWAAAALLVGLLCKETAAVVPVVLVAHEWLLRRRFAPRELAPAAAALACYAALRVAALDAAAPAAAPLAGAATNVLSAVAYYGWHALVPVPLNFAPELPRLGLGVALAVAVGVAAVAAVIAWTGRAQAFAVVLVALPILPTLYVAATAASAGKVVAERYLYLPSAGVALLFGALLAWLPTRRWVPVALGCAAVLVAAATTVARNRVWEDPVALWTDAVAKSPSLAYAHEGRAFALLRAGRRDDGNAEFAHAARLDPGLRGRYVAAGVAARARGQTLQAVVHLQTASVMDPGDAAARLELVETYRASGWHRLAADEYRAAIAIRGDSAEARNNLGILLAQAGDYAAALAEFELALERQPDNPEIRRNAARARELSRKPRQEDAAPVPRGHPQLGR
jgi:Tfp pilus assembly protein PilF